MPRLRPVEIAGRGTVADGAVSGASRVKTTRWTPDQREFHEESLFRDYSRCARVLCRPKLCTKAHRQVREGRLRKHATILRREPQRGEDGDGLFSCRKAVLSKQGAYMGRDRSGRQDMDLRFLITIALLLFAALSVTQRGPWVRFGGWPLYT